MLMTVLASQRKMAARSSFHAQRVSKRVVQLALSYLAYILMHLRATWQDKGQSCMELLMGQAWWGR